MASGSQLTEDNYLERINLYTESDWKPLFDLIPSIENTEEFGKWAGGEKDKDGVFSLPYMDADEIVNEFHQLVYNIPVIISFDWGSWDEGRRIAGDENFDFDTIDIPEKCKIITAIVRNDRYCEGALVSAFESGLILKILKSVERGIRKTSIQK
jgi:hypothetical protein